MAVVPPSDIVDAVLENLDSAALQEIKQSWGLHDKIERLIMEVSFIKHLLADAEAQQIRDRFSQLWLTGLKEVMCDADDLLDDLATQVLRERLMAGAGNKMTRKVRSLLSIPNKLAYRFRMSHKIMEITEIIRNRYRFYLEGRLVERPVMTSDRGQSCSLVPAIVVGRASDKEAIKELLLDSSREENVSVIPILGIAGLGKTTLAQLIYNDKDVEEHFDSKIWWCESDDCDLKTILKGILESVTGSPVRDLELDALIGQLKWRIVDRRYLLVLDDVRNENYNTWDKLRSCLMGGAHGSKILVTTRSARVAKLMGTVSPYRLGTMSEDDGWYLLRHYAFPGGEAPEELKEIAREIARKCAPVPIVVRAVADSLRYRRTRAEWLRWRDECSEVVLKLWYQHIPSPLKQCFAYCSLFPKDSVINVETMIHLWIAQGLVRQSHHDRRCLEDIGKEYFHELLSCSFFKEEEKDEFGKTTSCQLHDLMHDLAMLVAGTEYNTLSINMEHTDLKTRHLSLDFNLHLSPNMELYRIIGNAERLRTFLLPCQDMWLCDEKEGEKSSDEDVFSQFPCARVLDLHNLGIKRVSSSIEKLKHLRYLDLSFNSGIKTLPSCIGWLLNLQVLKLSYCEGLKELPGEIINLVNLRHLYCEGCRNLTHMPLGLGQLASLQTLTCFVLAKDNYVSEHVSSLRELNRCNKLRGALEVRNLGYVGDRISESDVAILNEMDLERLTLSWDRDDDVNNGDATYDELLLQKLEPHQNLKALWVLGFGGVKFPDWLSSLTNLVTIGIQDCKRCQHLPPLSGLPSLKYLTLGGLTSLEYIESKENSFFLSGKTFFPSLKTLWLWDCPNLKRWWKSCSTAAAADCDDDMEGTTTATELPRFNSLCSLYIWRCPNLSSMPLFPNLNGELWLSDARIELLQQTMKMRSCTAPSTSSHSSPIPPLSNLKKLWILRIQDLESLPEDGLQDLNSLQQLTIEDCSGLASLPQVMRHISSLQNLYVSGCSKLMLSDESNLFEDWPSHIHIEIDGEAVQRRTAMESSSGATRADET